MTEPRRVVQVGLGTIGRTIAQMALRRTDLVLLGAVDQAPDVAGRDLAEVLGVHGAPGVVATDIGAALVELRPDLVLHATSSRLAVVEPQLTTALEAGCDVVSTCEELAFPFVDQPDLSRRLDAVAQASGVCLLGTGINPGFVMDLLPSVLSIACEHVERMTVTRVVDTGHRREQLRVKTGAGLSVDDFHSRAASGELGHVGLGQSLQMLGRALGWTFDDVSEAIEARVSSADAAPVGGSEPVTGLRQRAIGRVAGTDRLVLDLIMEVGATDPRDEISIEGRPSFKVTIPGGIHGDIATGAIVVNAARSVDVLPAGLRSMIDLFRFAGVSSSV